jgi:DNA (cytosine-5)-methyltransferase 1
MSSINTLDLFCGIGGLTLGMEKAGLSCILGVDYWPDAGKTFQHNHPSTPFLCADLTAISPEDIVAKSLVPRDSIDIVVGGPPCQGFSTVGKRTETDPRNRLWERYLDVVDYVRPAYVLIENVEGMNVMGGGAVRDSIIAAFNQIGYAMKSRVLLSADYGVPQLRKRIVFLGWLPPLPEPAFPHPSFSRNGYVTVRDAIFDLPHLQSGQLADKYSEPPFSDYQLGLRGTETTLHNHEAAKHPVELVNLLSHIPDGGNRKSIPDSLQPKSGFHNSYARLASDKPAIAVTSNMRKPSSARSTHPTQNRGLTVREGMRLQTFPDSFVVLGTRTSQYLQVGNAVPPRLGYALGLELVKALKKASALEISDARKSRAIVTTVKQEPVKQRELFDQSESSVTAEM